MTVGLHDVVEIQRRLAEELIRALPFELQQGALNRADTRRRNVAILSRKLRRVIADVLQHGTQIFRIEEQQTVVVRNPKTRLSTSIAYR